MITCATVTRQPEQFQRATTENKLIAKQIDTMHMGYIIWPFSLDLFVLKTQTIY